MLPYNDLAASPCRTLFDFSLLLTDLPPPPFPSLLPHRHHSLLKKVFDAVYRHMSADWSPLCCRGDVDVSAVCQYQIADVKKVFEGAYKEYREASLRWGRFTGVVPSPRPGSVRTTRGTRGSGDEA